jgi:hypothetical protein
VHDIPQVTAPLGFSKPHNTACLKVPHTFTFRVELVATSISPARTPLSYSPSTIPGLQMADPLSIAGTLVGILAFAASTTSELISFYDAFKDYKGDILEILNSLETLGKTVAQIKQSLERFPQYKESKQVLGELQVIADQAKQLQHFLLEDKSALQGSEKIGDVAHRTSRAKTKEWSRKIQYPFKQTKMKKLRETAHSLSANLCLILSLINK